ncbi:MAG: response regulator [Opitutaceae bacterium]|nr:response regulator [Opitutaceae bacterium]
MTPLSILIVDDDESARNVFRIVLERAGYSVTAVGSGQEALALLESCRFHVVLTDVIMPDVDGLEIITAAKRLQPDARLIVMSGGSSYLGAEFCLKLARAMSGGTSLQKPFTLPQLLAAVQGTAKPVAHQSRVHTVA